MVWHFCLVGSVVRPFLAGEERALLLGETTDFCRRSEPHSERPVRTPRLRYSDNCNRQVAEEIFTFDDHYEFREHRR